MSEQSSKRIPKFVVCIIYYCEYTHMNRVARIPYDSFEKADARLRDGSISWLMGDGSYYDFCYNGPISTHFRFFAA